MLHQSDGTLQTSTRVERASEMDEGSKLFLSKKAYKTALVNWQSRKNQ